MTRNIMPAIITAAVFSMILAAVAFAADRGPSQIDIYGGNSGKVSFPHAQHQDRIKDCNVCHSVFPQETDAIKTMKAEGKIKPKKVMNLQCIKCHKQEKKAGNPSGPLTCKTCHRK
jgi:hypothetical protein